MGWRERDDETNEFHLRLRARDWELLADSFQCPDKSGRLRDAGQKFATPSIERLLCEGKARGYRFRAAELGYDSSVPEQRDYMPCGSCGFRRLGLYRGCDCESENDGY